MRQQPPEPFRIVAYIGHQSMAYFLTNHVSLAPAIGFSITSSDSAPSKNRP